ncbi:MAG: Na(+)-translocating NADH-quinone reductase subunit A [Flavobacteriales bacterium]|nr:Na(+)-translocating NADH-quinone reductase subunit A [Flavobacteriales bacterium]
MSKDISIKRGLDIPLLGEAERVTATAEHSETILINPADFKNLTPKMLVKQGEQVLAGTPLFFSKDHPELKVGSPVSGEVAEVVRGDKRKILGVKILADKETRYAEFPVADPTTMASEQVLQRMLDQCLLAFVKRRPYGTAARPNDRPKAIFISGFDSAPLSADVDYVLHGKEKEFQAGLNVLGKLTAGKVHLTLHRSHTTSEVLKNAKGVQIHWISGPHPSGNVGVQIHHISPINKGEVVWTVAAQDVAVIGKAFLTGHYDASRIVALVGSEVSSPKYYKVAQGASIASISKGQMKEGKLRYISGNVLTGSNVGAAGNLGFFDSTVSVIPEGDHPKFFITEGWAGAGLNKHSASRSYFSWLMPGRKYRLDTNTNGEHRAYVATGEYENVFPMDIYPQHLVKAVMIGDIELMENLGIYEVDDEDFALCEYVCTSKTPVQEVIRGGLALIEKECG